jgi:hypothetical protein
MTNSNKVYPEGVPRRICKKDLVHPTEGVLLEKGKGYLTTPNATLMDGKWCVRVFTRFWFWIDADKYFEGCNFSEHEWSYVI